MKILYIAAEHVSGTLSTMKAEHERRGDECRFVTFWHSRWNFPDDICFELPFMPDRSWIRWIRNSISKDPYEKDSKSEVLKTWKPSTPVKALFAIRDRINWPRISRAIEQHKLDTFDIIHFDGGLDFTRDCRFAKECSRRGAGIVSFFHGSDLRSRGLIPELDEMTELRLSSEWDLIDLDPRIEYLYLPLDTSRYPDRPYRPHTPIRVCHAARNPLKGTAHVISAVEHLKKDFEIDLRLLQNVSYAESLRIKFESDIFVDQLTNEGGWGYGMSAVEALAMGLPVVTNIPEKMALRLGEHPFVQADSASLESVLRNLITNPNFAADVATRGQEWVHQRHDVRSVGDKLYAHYERLRWLKSH